jgi:chromosome segregation ATPase
MFRTVTAERAKIAELEESVARAEGQSNELRGELAAKEDALERLRAAASEAPTPDQLEAERAQAHEAKLAAEQAQAEAASTAAALAKERRVAEALRVELRAAEEEAGRARRAASEAVAQAPTQDELEQERRRADRANANLASARARAELAEAEAKSSLAQARAELRRTHEEAAATAEALNAEKQRGATLRGELAEARSEAAALADKVSELEQTAADAAQSSGALTAEQRTVERLRRELSAARKELEGAKRTAAEKPALEDLERERVRAEQAEAAAEQVRREASGLAAKVAELELELERARQEQRQSADVPAPATSVPAELERERTRADQAEAALSEQRTAAERAAAGAEKANRKAAAATAAADAERQAAEALRVELDSVRAELEQARLVQAGSDAPAPAEDSVPTAIEDAVPTAIEEAARAEDLPRWAPDSQRALAAALATATEWRVAIKQAVKIIGSEGNWDAVVALSPDQRQPFMKCLAMWNREEKKSNAFETRAWQHRHKLPAGTAAPQPQALVALDATDDPVLKAAASEGMGSAALVPITDGTQLLGMLQLFSAHDEPPAPQVMVSLEAVALQLAGVARLLNSANTPHWHYGRL